MPHLLQVVTIICNMARQHREPHLGPDNAEQLRRYAGSAVSKHNSLDDALEKAKAKSRYWERKAKEGTDRATGAEKERDEAKEESQIARLAAIIEGDARTWGRG